MLSKPENLNLKIKFNPMVEYLIETNPTFLATKKVIDKKEK